MKQQITQAPQMQRVTDLSPRHPAPGRSDQPHLEQRVAFLLLQAGLRGGGAASDVELEEGGGGS